MGLTQVWFVGWLVGGGDGDDKPFNLMILDGFVTFVKVSSLRFGYSYKNNFTM